MVGLLPAGCIWPGSNRPQLPTIWSRRILTDVIGSGAVIGDGPLPELGRLHVLPAIFEASGQAFQGLGAGVRLGAIGHAFVDLDVVELVGQLETLDAGGQLGDGFVVAERVQGEGARFVVALRFLVAATEAVLGHRLHAELLLQELGEDQVDLTDASGIQLGGLGQEPAPAFAVGLSGCIALGHAMVDGIAVGVNGSAGGVVVVIIVGFIVVGQLGKIAQVLQAPGLVIARTAEDHVGEIDVELGQVLQVVFALRLFQGLLHELQGANAIALHGVDVLAAFAPVAAIELPGRDVAVMFGIDIGVAFGRGVQEPPVLLVHFDDGFPEFFQLVASAELRRQSTARSMSLPTSNGSSWRSRASLRRPS